MTSSPTPFGSDAFVGAIGRSARARGGVILMQIEPDDIEVWAYALRELSLMTDPEVVPDGVPDRAKVLLEGLATIAKVEYQPLVKRSER